MIVFLCYRRGKKTKQYGPKSWRIGFATPHNFNTTEAELVVAKCGFIAERVSKFFRFQLHDSIIYSCEYSRMTKANSYTVSYTTDEASALLFGMIRCFLELVQINAALLLLLLDILLHLWC